MLFSLFHGLFLLLFQCLAHNDFNWRGCQGLRDGDFGITSYLMRFDDSLWQLRFFLRYNRFSDGNVDGCLNWCWSWRRGCNNGLSSNFHYYLLKLLFGRLCFLDFTFRPVNNNGLFRGGRRFESR